MHIRYPSKRDVDSRQQSPLQWPSCDSNILMASAPTETNVPLRFRRTVWSTRRRGAKNIQTFNFQSLTLSYQKGTGIGQSRYSNSLWVGRSAVRTPVGARDFFFSKPVQTSPSAHPDSSIIVTGTLYRRESGRSVALTTHPLLAPKLKMGTAILLPPVCASIGMLRGDLYVYPIKKIYNPTCRQ
jgi:hypothetical protein